MDICSDTLQCKHKHEICESQSGAWGLSGWGPSRSPHVVTFPVFSTAAVGKLASKSCRLGTLGGPSRFPAVIGGRLRLLGSAKNRPEPLNGRFVDVNGGHRENRKCDKIWASFRPISTKPPCAVLRTRPPALRSRIQGY